MVPTPVLDLVYWKDPKVSGLAFFAGLVAFFILGVWEWSSLGLVCLIASGHLAVRMAYYKGSEVLAAAQLTTARTAPKVPEEWISQEEAAQYVAKATALINGVMKQAFSLSYCTDPELTLKWIGGLLGVAYACRLFGTLGLSFLAFVGAFVWPKLYESKHKEIDALAKAAADKLGEAYAMGAEQAQAALVKLNEKLAKPKGGSGGAAAAGGAPPAVGVPVAEGKPVEEDKKKL